MLVFSRCWIICNISANNYMWQKVSWPGYPFVYGIWGLGKYRWRRVFEESRDWGGISRRVGIVTPIPFFFSSQESVPSASPTGTPKHSVRKMTSTEDPKGTHSEGLFMMPPAGMSLGSLKSEFGPSTSTRQQGQQATPSVSQVSSSPGKRGERSCVMEVGKFMRPCRDLRGHASHTSRCPPHGRMSLVIIWFWYWCRRLKNLRM